MALFIFGRQKILDEKDLNCIFGSASKNLKIKKDVNLIFTSKRKILELNYVYRGKKDVTDILSFCMDESDILGELYVYIPKVKNNAKRYNNSEKEELSKIFVHGILHLCGYLHKTKKDEKIMDKREEEILKKL